MDREIGAMKKHKTKIITAVLIIAALTIAWFYGGDFAVRSGTVHEAQSAVGPGSESVPGSVEALGKVLPDSAASGDTSAAETVDIDDRLASADGASTVDSSAPAGNTAGVSASAGKPPQTMETAHSIRGDKSKDSLSVGIGGRLEDINTNGDKYQTGSDTGLDKSQTDQAPKGNPLPVEPENMIRGDGSFNVFLTVRCDMILGNIRLLDKEKHELIPEDGVVFPTTEVTAYDGESVFNILQRTMKQAKIHMTFRSTPIYNSSYIEAINNLYEFEAGELSGWMYCVNGWYPNYGCSRYLLKPGDEIEWNYSCDLGRDLGQDGDLARQNNG